MIVLVTQVMVATANCAGDLDCSLNGRCVQGLCVCEKPWAGDTCGVMRFKDVNFPQGYGMSPNLTAWGGGAIFDGKQVRCGRL